MRHRERPPVEEQGRSPYFTPGVETPERVLGPRRAAGVWVVVTLLVAGYAAVLTAHLAGLNLPLAHVIPSVVIAAVGISRWVLNSNAAARPAPTRRQKVRAVVGVALAGAWWVCALWLFYGTFQTSSAPLLIAVPLVTVALSIGAFVLSYRVQFFRRRPS